MFGVFWAAPEGRVEQWAGEWLSKPQSNNNIGEEQEMKAGCAAKHRWEISCKIDSLIKSKKVLDVTEYNKIEKIPCIFGCIANFGGAETCLDLLKKKMKEQGKSRKV